VVAVASVFDGLTADIIVRKDIYTCAGVRRTPILYDDGRNSLRPDVGNGLHRAPDCAAELDENPHGADGVVDVEQLDRRGARRRRAGGEGVQGLDALGFQAP
jgi:hypothetical protein